MFVPATTTNSIELTGELSIHHNLALRRTCPPASLTEEARRLSGSVSHSNPVHPDLSLGGNFLNIQYVGKSNRLCTVPITIIRPNHVLSHVGSLDAFGTS